MHFVFSTALAVYTFDCSCSTLRRLSLPADPEYYGISAFERHIVFSSSGFDNASLNCHTDYLQEPRGYLSALSQEGCVILGGELLQPHQIECHGDSVLCANSGRNCITVYHPTAAVFHNYPTSSRYDVLPDGSKANHFNSVHVHDGVIYVVAHNYAMLSTLWLFSWPDFTLINVIGTNSGAAHNVMRNGDDLLICNSRGSALYSVSEKQNIWTLEGADFITRGLAATPEHLFVGLTSKASRGDRKYCDAGICVLDRRTMRLVDRYHFAGIGGLHELRLLDREDAAHGGSVIRSEWLTPYISAPL